jgi:hypothetical protein
MLAAAGETQARQQESRAMLAGLQPKVSLDHAGASSQQSSSCVWGRLGFAYIVNL